MRRLLIPSIIGLVTMCAVCGAGAGAFWALGNASGGPSIHGVPIYPGATNVSVQDLNSFGASSSMVIVSSNGSSTSQSSSGGTNAVGTGALTGVISSAGEDGFITFSTHDTPQQVYAFYDASLSRAGWTIASASGLPNLAPPLVVGPTSGPRTYTYQSLLPRIPFIHRPDAMLALSVDNGISGTGNDVGIFLVHQP